MERLKLQIVTPEAVVFEDEVDEVNLPTLSGEIGVLSNHVPLVSLVRAGEIRIRKDKNITYLATYGGCIEIEKEGVKVMVDMAERVEEIDELKAIEAKKRAEHLLEEAADNIAFGEATALLEQSLARLKVVKRKKSH